MISAEFPRDARGHYLLPIRFYGDGVAEAPVVDALVDTGASKCMMPARHNEELLKLKPTGSDDGVVVAGGKRRYDYVTVPRVVIARVEIKASTDARMILVDTDFFVPNVKVWLGDDFAIGMNFLDQFDITLKRTGRMILEK